MGVFLLVGVGSAADVGGVSGPVSGGGSLPLDGDSDVDAQGAGADRAARLAAGEEPGRVGPGEDRVAAAGGDLLQGRLGDGPGQGDRDITEADADRCGPFHFTAGELRSRAIF
ncbi:hypothetical protein [Kitasatospora cineracea]|uniref:hypothetical protein n=1 Tax=Kitasatospora cineracea TaxID=88074 RepID=UPI0036A0A57E